MKRWNMIPLIAISTLLVLSACGGEDDRDDGGDSSSSSGCSSDEFECDNGNCIFEWYENDGADDCGDGSDENYSSNSDEKLCNQLYENWKNNACILQADLCIGSPRSLYFHCQERCDLLEHNYEGCMVCCDEEYNGTELESYCEHEKTKCLDDAEECLEDCHDPTDIGFNCVHTYDFEVETQSDYLRCYGCNGGNCQSSEGTWYDSSSGLTWQNPPADSTMSWEDAKDYCANLSLDGNNDWRLPSISELRSLIRGCPDTETGGNCNIDDDGCLEWLCRDDSCTGCFNNDGPANGCYWPDEMEGPCSYSKYWSSSPVEDHADYAWGVYFDLGEFIYGIVYRAGIYYREDVRCVR